MGAVSPDLGLEASDSELENTGWVEDIDFEPLLRMG